MKGGEVLLVALTIVGTLVAGCTGGDPEASTSSTSSAAATTGTTGSTSAAPTSSSPPPNEPPVPTFSAVITNGSAPLNVTFEFGATDGDGDDLTWTLDADGDNESDAEGDSSGLPGNFTFTYEAAGVYNATFVVSDEASSANETFSINVTAGGGFEDLVFESSVSGLWVPEAGYLAEGNEHTFELAAAPTKITFTIEWGTTTATDLDMYIFDPTGEEVGAANAVNDPATAPGEDPVVIEDPAVLSRFGTWTIEVIGGASAEGEYTVTVDFE